MENVTDEYGLLTNQLVLDGVGGISMNVMIEDTNDMGMLPYRTTITFEGVIRRDYGIIWFRPNYSVDFLNPCAGTSSGGTNFLNP